MNEVKSRVDLRRKGKKMSKDDKSSLDNFIKQHLKAYSDEPDYLLGAAILINQFIDEKGGYRFLSEEDKKTIRFFDYKLHKRSAKKIYIVQILITDNVKEDLCEKGNVVVLKRNLTSFTSKGNAIKFFIQLVRDANIRDFPTDIGHSDSHIKKIEYENSSGNKVDLEMMESDLFTREHDAIRVFNWDLENS